MAGTLPTALGLLIVSDADTGIVLAQYIGASLLAAPAYAQTHAGVDANLVRPSFDGFGVLTNYTYMDTHGGEPLQGASKNNYTASMYYEKGWFGGRLAYTWRDEFYTGVEGNSQDDRIQQDFGTLDANISFNINDHVSAVIEATNILEEVDHDVYMPIGLTGNYTDNGRRVLVGLRGTF